MAATVHGAIRELLEQTIVTIDALLGASDREAGQWTYRVVAKHVLTLEQHSLKAIAADRAGRPGAT